MIVASEETSRNLRRRGALILAVAGLIWVSLGTSGTAHSVTGRVLTVVVALGVTLAAIALAIRSGGRPVRGRRQPLGWLPRVGVINLVQLAAIAVAVPTLIAVHRTSLVAAAVCLIVGLHFIPLAGLFDQWQYRWTGLLLALAAVTGIAIDLGASRGALADSVVGIGAAVVLWATALHVAVSD